MIRRRGSDDLLLVTQEDHALLAGRLAAHWGNTMFPAPHDPEVFVASVDYHDAGWSLHDSQPTLNQDHFPAAFYEMPVTSYARLWVASVAAASARGGPMGGLLTSLHFTNLASRIPLNEETEAVQWLIRDFLTCQRQRQHDYCTALGLTLEIDNGTLRARSAKDKEILRNFAILRAVDWLSLILCARDLPAFMEEWRGSWYVNGDPSRTPAPVRAEWRDDCTLMWSPWPLNVDEFVHSLPVHVVPDGHYRHDRDLQRVYADAPVENLTLKLLPL